jgi:hypothetical protein
VANVSHLLARGEGDTPGSAPTGKATPGVVSRSGLLSRRGCAAAADGCGWSPRRPTGRQVDWPSRQVPQPSLRWGGVSGAV